MVTDFGKFCRKLRIDHDELMKDMAKKLDVTSSYLSAVEKGKRDLPDDWIEKISKAYNLSASQLSELGTIHILKSLTVKETAALEEAMSVLYLNDRSDYLNGLWRVVKAIVGDNVVNSDNFEIRDWLELMKTFK